LLLINHEANLNARDADGGTPLHWAASSRSDVAKALIIAGATLNIKDSSGLTPLDYVNDEARVLLSKKGAKLGSQFVMLEYNLDKHELIVLGAAGETYQIQYSTNHNTEKSWPPSQLTEQRQSPNKLGQAIIPTEIFRLNGIKYD